MTVWYHLVTISIRRHALRTAGLIALCVALTTTLLLAHPVHAVPNITKTISFQGRLQTAGGAVVPDGHYNIQFKIYQDGAGTSAGNPGGALKWTESYINNGSTGGVEVKNGFFSVSLGSVTPFGTSVDWNQDTLWLSMNIAGSATTCTTFGTAPCGADGEMLPMKRITATPYSINSGAVGGKTANDLVQLGQGAQTDASSASSIFINKTGTGNLVQLQAGGSDAFTINNAGNITMGSTADQSITVATAASGAGKNLTVKASSAASGSALAGGDLVVQGGAGDGSANSGNVIVKSNGTDTTGTFQVQNTTGSTLFNIDTKNSIVSAGTIKLASGAPGSTITSSLWNSQAISTTAFVADETPINVATTFKSDVAGYVTGVKFYNPEGGNNNGNDIGKLWACNSPTCSLGSGGASLASVNFPRDTSVGWKTATFSTPVHISPDTYYIVSYYSSTGKYTATPSYFVADHHNAPLHAMASGTTPNGVYIMNSGPSFPEATYGSANYWVDVNFQGDTSSNQISSTDSLLITSGGAMTVGPTSQALKLQGSSVDIGATNGGNVTMQGGNATVSNGNGGSITLSGGAGNGTGASGLVILTTPTFSTSTSDANCYTGGAIVASDCTITKSSVDNSSAVIVGFNTAGQTATLPNPTNTTAGRIIYVMAASDSQDFTLSINGGGPGNLITMHHNTTATILSNGTNWTVAGGSNSATLQDAYNNTSQSAGGTELTLSNGATANGLTIHDSGTNPVNGTLLEVKNAADAKLFSVNSNNTEFASDGLVHDGTTFATNWSAAGSATVARITSDGQEASDSAQVSAGTSVGNGIGNKLAIKPLPNTHYRVSVYAKLSSGSAFTDFTVRYSPDGGTSFVDCITYNTQTITTSGWDQITCEIDATSAAVTTPYIYFVQPTTAGSARTFLVDNFALGLSTSGAPSVQIGSGAGGSQATLFTLDRSADAPVVTDNNALLGSMYYDTTLGKVQCYEAAGWGTCGASPDIFVTLSPEYANAVTHGSGTGTLSSDLCSDTLNINDGSSSQPTICGSNETYNFYKWTSSQGTAQTKDIYVTYQLPATFKKFVSGATSLTARTDGTNASVAYQIYRNNSSGLTACSASLPVSTGPQSTWQNVIATGSDDPANCSFAAGESLVFKITLSSLSDANAYASNLSFVVSNH